MTGTQEPTLLGTVADLSKVLKMELARYTADAGNHAHIELRPTPIPRHSVRVLFLGDIFGPAGLRAVEAHVPALREELELDLVVANGENVADGAGITGRLADRLLAAGSTA